VVLAGLPDVVVEDTEAVLKQGHPLVSDVQ